MGSRKAEKPLHYDLEVWKDAMRLARGIYARHLRIARGSLMEVDTQLWIARDLGFAEDIAELQGLVQRVAAMLSALINSKTKASKESLQ